MRRSLFLGVVFGCFPLSPVAVPAPREAGRPAAGSPTEAVERFVAAARAGDAAAFQAQLSGRASAAFKFRRAEDAWDAALDARFGAAVTLHTRPTVEDELAELGARTYRVKVVKEVGAERAELTVWVTRRAPGQKETIREETWAASKESGNWRLIPTDRGYVTEAVRTEADGRDVRVLVVGGGDPTPEMAAREAAQSTAHANLYAIMSDNVRAGMYLNRSEAVSACSEAYRKLRDRERQARRK